jgi:hypothetical protein
MKKKILLLKGKPTFLKSKTSYVGHVLFFSAKREISFKQKSLLQNGSTMEATEEM